LGPRTAASSPPTCKGTTPPRRATSVRGIRIHAIDIVQPPGIGISPIADMDAHQTIVSAALAAKSSAETPKNACWKSRPEAIRREIQVPQSRHDTHDFVREMDIRFWLEKAQAESNAFA
jgi:hypothetical protein